VLLEREKKCSPGMEVLLEREKKCPPGIEVLLEREKKCFSGMEVVLEREKKCFSGILCSRVQNRSRPLNRFESCACRPFSLITKLAGIRFKIHACRRTIQNPRLPAYTHVR